MPTTPQNEAGQEMEPPVETPNATWPSIMAAAAAAPPLEPPQALPESNGFNGTPKALFVLNVPKPNSSMLVLPSNRPPAFLRRCTGSASNGGLYPSNILEPAPGLEVLGAEVVLGGERECILPIRHALEQIAERLVMLVPLLERREIEHHESLGPLM